MLFFKQLNTLPGPLFKIYSCWSVGVPGGLCMPHGEGVAIRESQFSQWAPRMNSAQQAWKRVPSSFEASCCPLPSAHVFSVLGLFFLSLFILRSSTCFLVISTLRNEGTKSHPLGLWGLGLTLLTWAMDHLCGSLGKIALRVILIWVFNLSGRYFFRSTWAFTYVSFSLDDC